jgi:hypothetical protein
MYLSINHNPKDILNMSISKFYASCQHLYSGGYREQVLGNVFDPNSVPAFLYFKSELSKDDGWKLSDKLFLSRMMIRSIDTPEESKNKFKLYFDRCYPDRMKNLMDDIVTKYTKMESSFAWGDGEYIFEPDIPEDVKIKTVKKQQIYLGQFGAKQHPFVFDIAEELTALGYYCFFTTPYSTDIHTHQYYDVKHLALDEYLKELAASLYTVCFD